LAINLAGKFRQSYSIAVTTDGLKQTKAIATITFLFSFVQNDIIASPHEV
jgi:hypothetical protein